MNFDNLEKVTKANSIRKSKTQDFDIKYNPKTERFKFSEEVFKELGLLNNSLVQYNVYEGEEKGIYLNVVPGDSGVFMKSNNAKNKGREFKNNEIVSALSEINNVSAESSIYFTLENIGDYNNNPMYVLVVDEERVNRIVNGDDKDNDEDNDACVYENETLNNDEGVNEILSADTVEAFIAPTSSEDALVDNIPSGDVSSEEPISL